MTSRIHGPARILDAVARLRFRSAWSGLGALAAADLVIDEVVLTEVADHVETAART